ncbi:uncharacterized protein [Venturia canescens]|uniref:uncharacterized protein n=1 Tax=Venturia canescens TaxID=32260 RepID=UPI001C9C800A|nr:uncharacterized protein LOC122415907 [Venturia canescens]
MIDVTIAHAAENPTKTLTSSRDICSTSAAGFAAIVDDVSSTIFPSVVTEKMNAVMAIDVWTVPSLLTNSTFGCNIREKDVAEFGSVQIPSDIFKLKKISYFYSMVTVSDPLDMKNFTLPRRRRARSKRVSQRMNYLCKCGRKYTQKCSLDRHVKYECGKAPSVPCPDCGKLFKHRHHVIEHMRKYCPFKQRQ